MSISVCMIVKDEEKVLENSLTCASKFADEIIVVDTGSTDSTKQIAKKFTDKVFDFEWCDDFAKARNFSFSKATCNYMMWLDADDIILSEDIEKLNKLKSRLKADVYMLKYVASFDENYKPTFSYYRERIVKCNAGFIWNDPVHEVIIPRGKIEYLDISIYHNKKETKQSDRNLKIYENLIKSKIRFSPRQQFYYARELFYNNKIDEAIGEFSKFLIGDGWIENKIEACLDLAKCYSIKKQYQNALTALLGSFVLATPRGEILYEIGNVFLEENKIEQAIYWYQLAKKAKPDTQSGAFVAKDCYDFLPNLQLCVCYYRLGNLKKSKYYHDLAKQIHPNDTSVLHNEKYFESIKV